MNTPIRIRGLNKSFGQLQVLRTLDWEIEAGSIVGLLGRNGAGKSTLIECLLGLRDAQGGSVQLFGEDTLHLSEATKARIGYVPQSSELFQWLTPRQLMDYFRAFYTRWNDAKVNELMQRWELPWTQSIGKLSPGQKQRLSIIRALAHEPELLVLDEPVSSLDPAGRREFLSELVDGVIDRKTTVVFSTHILSDLERVAMDVAFLKDGRIALQQPLDSLLEATWRVTGAHAQVEALNPRLVLRSTVARHGEACILAQFDDAELQQLKASTGLRMERVALEELFIEVTR
jgi:ABC-2 type transport system ATP-binding protein